MLIPFTDIIHVSTSAMYLMGFGQLPEATMIASVIGQSNQYEVYLSHHGYRWAEENPHREVLFINIVNYSASC